MNWKFIPSVICILIAVAGCTDVPEGLTPVTDFDVERYLGKWYEIARLDHRFERNMNNVSAVYSRGENGIILVQNRGFDTGKGSWRQIQGRARFRISEDIGSLKVSFFGPFYGGYHIIDIDKINYQYALVAGPSRSYLWILSRQKTLNSEIYRQLVTKAKSLGFDTDQLIRVEHNSEDE